MGADISKPDFTPEQKKVLFVIQDGISLVERPFESLAEKVGLTEEEFLSSLRYLCENGYIRRFGATLQHQVSGYAANAMVAWHAKQDMEETGRTMATFRNVTHCYQRRTVPGWPYNLYTMVHGKTEADCLSLIEEIAEKTGLADYQVLFSERELKRSNVRYFVTV